MSITGRIARIALGVVGWRVIGERPTVPKYVLIAAPHTSNWDFPLMLLCGMAIGIWPWWVGKHTLFEPPFGWFMRLTRGIPVDRRAPQNAAEQLALRFAAHETIALAVAPEGMRRHAPHWKSGFYVIAQRAGVPIAFGVLDYGRKEGGIGPLFYPTGDLRADMDRVRAFYADKRGRYPSKQGPVRLRKEEDDAA